MSMYITARNTNLSTLQYTEVSYVLIKYVVSISALGTGYVYVHKR